MFFRDKTAREVPPVPASLNHNSFEIPNGQREKPLTTEPDTAVGITPYLGLRARLSQVWFNRWTVLLVLVLIRVMLQIVSLNQDLADAQTKALAACSKVEDIGSAMASMPHYLSVGVNRLAAEGIEKVLTGFVDILFMILTGVEELILFVIEMYVGTYACLITALIHGGLDVSIAAINDVTNYFNSQIGNIAGTISTDVGNFQNTLNSFVSGIENVGNLFGANNKPPTIDLSADLNNLKNIKINDTSFVGDLTKLNATIPTFDQVQNLTKSALSIPFDDLKNLVNTSFATYSFDQSVFPVANKESLTFCSDNSLLVDFFDDLFNIVAIAKIVFLVVLIVLAVLMIIPMTLMEIRRYRKQRRLARVFTKYGYDAMDVAYIASRPFSATWGIRLASRFSGKRQLLVRWGVAYGTTLPAIFVVSLAIAGLFSCLCQYILYRVLQKEAPILASEVGNFAGAVVDKLENVSTIWANDANGVVLDLQNDINGKVLVWVVNATSAVNNTLNTFDKNIEDAISQVFNGTVLFNTVMDIFQCLVGRKIENVEAGLTWVHDQAHVTLPLFPSDLFSVGANSSITNDTSLTSFLSTPSTVTTDDITAAVDYVLDMLRNNIIQEALIAAGLLLVFIIVVLIGIIRSLTSMAVPGAGWTARGEGGQFFVDPQAAEAVDDGDVAYTGDRRRGPAPRSPQLNRSVSEASAAASTRFPRFGSRAADSVSPVSDGEDVVAPVVLRGEKLGETRQQVRGGKISKQWYGHARQSSHGQVEDAGR